MHVPIYICVYACASVSVGYHCWNRFACVCDFSWNLYEFMIERGDIVFVCMYMYFCVGG